jgi:WD40 repeat protein
MPNWSVGEALLVLDAVLAPDSLSNLEELMIRHCSEGKTYAQIAEMTGYDDDYIRTVGFRLWRRLSQAMSIRVSKSNFQAILRHYQESRSQIATNPLPETKAISHRLTDWGTAADVPNFYGRDSEMATLSRWVGADRCRLISILGMGGIGKSALAIRLAQTMQTQFDALIWRSLKSAPPLNELLSGLLKFLAPSPDASIPTNVTGKLEQLIAYLRQKRCLIILDNFDMLLQSGQQAGVLQTEYQEYHELLQYAGELSHISCILLTSREKPQGIDAMAGDRLPVRTMYLTGLDTASSQLVLDQKGLTGSELEINRLIDHYRGHPLGLKIVASSIYELFGGNITQFLQQGHNVFNGLRQLLARQMQRLSPMEQDILYWLAINCEPIALELLQKDLMPEPLPAMLLEALESLRRRSLIETAKTDAGFNAFTLQPVVMEYLIDDLIQLLCEEIATTSPHYFLSHALLKAQTEDNIRESQTRLILQPLAAKLLGNFGAEIALVRQLQTLVVQLQVLPVKQHGYGGGNLLNLLRYLKIDLRGFNFSGLLIRQALMHDITLHQTNFSRAVFHQCQFANTFGGVTCIAFSPDGQFFATSDSNGILTIWSVANMHPIARCQGHSSWVWSVAFHPTQPILASGAQDHTIRLWDSKNGACFRILQGHDNIVTDTIFSPDGRYLASSSTDSTIKLWEIKSGKCVQTLHGHDACVWSAVFTANSDRLFSGGEDNCIRYWDIQTGECLRVFVGHSQWIMAIALSPDGHQIASASMDGTIKLWCTNTGNCLHTLNGHAAPVVSVAFSPDGSTVASGSYDLTVRLWETRTGTCKQVFKKHTNRVWSVKFHPSGTFLASGGDDNTTRFWNPRTGESTTTLQGHSNSIYAIALYPNQPMVASGHEDQTVRLWRLPHNLADRIPVPPQQKTIEPFQALYGHQNRVLAIAFSPDGKTIASGSTDRTIKLWSPETERCRLTLQGHSSWIWDLAFHPSGKAIASASYDRTVKLWDVETGNCTQTLEGHLGSALSVGFSPDGQWLASGGYEQMLKLWRTESYECARTWYAHGNRIWTVAFSPNSEWLASAGDDQQVMVWDAKTGKCLQVLSGHQQLVTVVRFSPDGRQLVSGSADRTIKHWDVDTGECLQTLSGHQHWVWSLIFIAPNLLLSASQDESIQCWDLQTGQAFQYLEVPRPYAEMDITGAMGLTDAQYQTLTVLGACDRSFPHQDRPKAQT